MFSKRRFTICENNIFFGMCCFAPRSLVSAVSTWKFFSVISFPEKYYCWEYKRIIHRILNVYSKNWLVLVVLPSHLFYRESDLFFGMPSSEPFTTKSLVSADFPWEFFFFPVGGAILENTRILSVILNVYSKTKIKPAWGK